MCNKIYIYKNDIQTKKILFYRVLKCVNRIEVKQKIIKYKDDFFSIYFSKISIKLY